MNRIWAVARNLVREVLRMRSLIVFLGFTTVLYTLGFAWWLHRSTGQADEKVQTFLSYSLSMATILLSFVVIFVSISTITRDIKRKEIFTITTKPISRAHFLMGKLLGMAMLIFLLLFITGGIIYGTTLALAHVEPTTEAERRRLSDLVLIARTSVKPPLLDVKKQAKEETEKLVKERIRKENITDPVQIDVMRRTALKEITDELTRKLVSAIPPGQQKVWHFTGIEPIDRENGFIFIRYKQNVSANPIDEKTVGLWRYGPEDPSRFGGETRVFRKTIRTVHEFAIPVTEVSSTGDLYVLYENLIENAPVTVLFPPETGIEALFVVDTFEGNFLRTLSLIYLRLLFLSILGLAMGCWLSFPVAVLLVLIVFILGVASSFIAEVLKYEGGQIQKILIYPIMSLIPKFSAYDPIPQIERGKLVPWKLLGQCGLYMILIKGSILALFGYLMFKFRELARVIV